jgi:serine-type D-Ala-D-Ala carboxypeptidase (penicillin-binding protein 5/6)
LITRAAYGNRAFAAYVSTRKAKFPGKGTATYEIQNQNRLLWRYPGAIGVKTGFTRKARNTLVGAATRNGHTLVVALLQGKHGIHRDAIALLDWGFAAQGRVAPVGRLVDPLPAGAVMRQATSPVSTDGKSGDGGRPAGRRAGTGGLLAVAGLAFLLLMCGAGLRLRKRRRARAARPARGQAAG